MEENATAVAEEVFDKDTWIAEKEIELTKKYDEKFDIRLQLEINKISQTMQERNQQIVSEAIERYKRELAPPAAADIQKVLEQEYVEFKLEIKAKGEVHAFTLVELPQKIEKKMYRKIKDALVPFSSELASLSLNMLEGDAAKKIVQLMNTFEPLLDVMAGIAAVALNPFDEYEWLDEEWVRDNLSSTRIVNIVQAQVEVNRMRDFFSALFRGSKFLAG